jgi:hypothetical protein
MAFQVGDAIKIPWRNAKPVAVDARLYEAVTRMRSALIVAAKRRSTLTYSELAAAIDKIFIERGLTKALDLLAYDCQERKEPSLAALVVAMADGEVSTGYVGSAGPERERCYKFHR